MDPNATVDLLNDAITEIDLCSAYDAASDLARWIKIGGFTPDLTPIKVMPELLEIIKRGILARSNDGKCLCYACLDRRLNQGEF